MRFFLTNSLYKIGLIFLYACIATMILAPMACNTTVPKSVDYLNHMSGIIQAQVAIKEGQFPLRVAPLSHNGWSYPFFQFYSPTSYTIAGLISLWLAPTNPFIAYKLTIWFALLMGGLGMYRLVYWWLGSRAVAILSSVVYLLAPYNIIIIDRLGAFNEALALSFVPVVIYYTLQRYYDSTSNKTFLQTAIVWYLLMTVHLITFIYTSLFLGLFLSLNSLLNIKSFVNLLRVGLAYGFGCCLAIWYLAPVLLFNNILMINHAIDKHQLFQMYYPSLINLLSPTVSFSLGLIAPNGYRDSMSTIHPNIGLLILLAVGICVYIISTKKKLADTRADQHLLPLLILFFLAFALIWSPIDFWHWAPKFFKIIQYSWRLLGQVMWIGTLLFAAAIYWIFRNKFSIKYLGLGIVLIIISSSSVLLEKNQNMDDVSPLKLMNLPSILESEFDFNYDAYVVDVKKYPNFVNLIDNVLLFHTAPDAPYGALTLKLNLEHTLPRALLNSADYPYMLIEGAIPFRVNLNDQKLIAVINDSVYATYDLKSGPFKWKIPLKDFQDENSVLPLSFHFKLSGNKKKELEKFPIAIRKIELGGFLKPSKVMNVQQVQPYCQRKEAKTVCTINVPKTMRWIELPLLYYPEMLDIRINGKSATYQGVFYKGSLLAAVAPEPGQMNIIEFQFRGLVWANLLSQTAWGIAGLIFLYLNLQRLFYKTSVR